MITIELNDVENFNPNTNEFEYIEGGVVRFEYSLRALYEWEGKWRKPFLDVNTKLSSEEIYDFYISMALDPLDTRLLTREVTNRLSRYISDSNTATTFTTHEDSNTKKSAKTGKIYTSEEIYALMFGAGIPLVFEERNLNRLLVILKVISNNNSPPKKMSRSDILKQNAQINAQRKAKYKTKG